ncbi:MAG: F0F1 ATP synthase subunit B [Verrucomicrobiae bacterium]|nr:F0F1 ATP synthase subunit B [Verrucomicrobiae bacterium]
MRSLSAVIFVLCSTASLHAAGENAMEFRADTALWSIVVFVGLLFILRGKAWGPILEGLKKREETIRGSLEEAKRTRDEMATLQAKFQKELADAHQQIPKLMEQARKDAEQLAAEMRAKAAAEIQTERDRLRRELDIAKDQAIKELWEQSAQLATLISAKAIGRSLTEDDHRRLLDEAMKEMLAVSKN